MFADFTDYQLNQVYDWSNYWMFYFSIALLLLEVIRLVVKKRLNWSIVGDSVTNFVVYYAFITLNYVLLYASYVGGFYFVHEYFSLVNIPVNTWSVLACLLLADFAYYWEHRFSHRTALGWSTHTVHHSSPYFNLSVAYRFGPLDGVIPFFFNVPLVIIGFDPLLVLLCESLVLLYQTPIHTELVGRFARPIEAIFNTPSHHRVHHGANRQYHDKNYGGILIIWDRMFGTFVAENEPVRYGLSKQLESINPLVVFFHGLFDLGKKISGTRGLGSKVRLLVNPPVSD